MTKYTQELPSILKIMGDEMDERGKGEKGGNMAKRTKGTKGTQRTKETRGTKAANIVNNNLTMWLPN